MTISSIRGGGIPSVLTQRDPLPTFCFDACWRAGGPRDPFRAALAAPAARRDVGRSGMRNVRPLCQGWFPKYFEP